MDTLLLRDDAYCTRFDEMIIEFPTFKEAVMKTNTHDLLHDACSYISESMSC